jgi:DNA processing protein
MEKISVNQEGYPYLLTKIFDPPPFLYYRGLLPDKNDVLVAIVGSRACTAYGRQVAEDLAFKLAKEGLVIVSGLALGIDSIAHQATLDAGGRTIAVLGSGLDCISPRSHYHLAEEIVRKGGALISEFAPQTPPLPVHFPQRNRIIAGMSQATIVVEAAYDSGALITARFALEQGREVFAVPGPIYSPNSEGTNGLIKSGAYPVTSFKDVLEVLKIKPRSTEKRKRALNLTKEEETLLALLSAEPISIDKMKKISRLDIAVISATLVMLEIKGLVKNLGGGWYTKIKEER